MSEAGCRRPSGLLEVQHRAGIAVDDDRGELRAVAFARGLAVVVTSSVAAVTARLGAITRDQDRRRDGYEPKNANSQRPRGGKVVRSIYFPVPSSVLDHRLVGQKCARRPSILACATNHFGQVHRPMFAAQVALLAKVLFTNSFLGRLSEGEQSPGIRLGRPEFPKD